MARPTKQGIDYFPLDCQFDDKIEMYLIEKGSVGLSVMLTLWQMIYSNEGYYIEDNIDLHLLIKRRIDVSANDVSGCINVCLSRNIFNKTIYQKYKILTSKAIQKRYFDAAKKKKGVKIFKELLLICVDSYTNLVNSDENLVKVDGNATNVNVKEEVNVEVDVNVKEELHLCEPNGVTKVKKAVVKIPYEQIHEMWNEMAIRAKLPQTEKLTTVIKTQIKQRWLNDLPEIDRWVRFFRYIENNSFLNGQAEPGPGRNKPMRAKLWWVTQESNFAKIRDKEFQ